MDEFCWVMAARSSRASVEVVGSMRWRMRMGMVGIIPSMREGARL